MTFNQLHGGTLGMITGGAFGNGGAPMGPGGLTAGNLTNLMIPSDNM
jgi:hypothetical protein